jgi:hypothetical protein
LTDDRTLEALQPPGPFATPDIHDEHILTPLD